MVFILSFDRIAQENKGNSKGKGDHLQQVDEVIPCTIVGYKVAIIKFNKDFVQYYTRF
jgi:hypothetical protein